MKRKKSPVTTTGTVGAPNISSDIKKKWMNYNVIFGNPSTKDNNEIKSKAISSKLFDHEKSTAV